MYGKWWQVAGKNELEIKKQTSTPRFSVGKSNTSQTSRGCVKSCHSERSEESRQS